MSTLEIIDRSALFQAMNNMLSINPETAAVITVDMHRGHLDPTVATQGCKPEDCKRVIRHTKELLGTARRYRMPVIHVVLVMRQIPGVGNELMALPFVRCLQESGQRALFRGHNIEGSIQTEIIPELFHKSDYVINNKKRLDCFYGTDLEILLDTLGINTTVIVGINTNTCVLSTSFTAYNKGYKLIVISDCVASMYGPDLHALGLEAIGSTLGWVLTLKEFKEKLPPAKRPRGKTSPK